MKHFRRISLLISGSLFFSLSMAQVKPGSLGRVGNSADIITTTTAGAALIGGGGNVPGAFKWMIAKSGGGDAVVLTASGNDGYNKDIYALGGVNSVETLNITSRELADNDTVAMTVRNAEMLFIAGGDQSRYMNNWRSTKLNAAINYLMNEKKVPVGGTSAGCAILTGLYYSGENGSAVSDSSMLNPYNNRITLYNNDFLHAPFLQQVISDQHYLARKREGRHVSFLARIIKDFNLYAKGIAPDERTAVCIDENGIATVIGESKAYFIITDKSKTPEICEPGKPLKWKRKEKALQVYEIQATAAGSGSFSVADFDMHKASGGKWYWWWVNEGRLFKKEMK
ncbi:MAG: cyanophycinase [Chitinophagaceae bacterium]|nr:cyanophycinase [Chitinophagaceae bacterium]